ncbi:hypothetical protein MUK42_20062, partial [Musa troglodytarum]
SALLFPLALTLLLSPARALTVDGVRILVELAIRGSERVRENVATALLNLVKSSKDKMVGDVKEMDRAKATMRALAGNNSGDMLGDNRGEEIEGVEDALGAHERSQAEMKRLRRAAMAFS